MQSLRMAAADGRKAKPQDIGIAALFRRIFTQQCTSPGIGRFKCNLDQGIDQAINVERLQLHFSAGT